MNPGNSWRTASARGMVVPYFMHNWRADSRGLPRTTCADTLQMVSGVTQPAGTCSSATCVSSGAIAGRGQRHRSLDHSSGRTLFTGSRSPARVGVPRRIGPGRRRRSPAPSVLVGRRANRLAGRSRRQVTSTRSGVYRARASKSPSQCRTGRSARTANAPMGQSMRTRTVSPRRRHCRYSTAARSKSPVCIGRAGLRHRRERRSPCGATSAVLSSPLRFRPARFSAPPLPRGPSSRTAGHPVPASRRGSVG